MQMTRRAGCIERCSSGSKGFLEVNPPVSIEAAEQCPSSIPFLLRDGRGNRDILSGRGCCKAVSQRAGMFKAGEDKNNEFVISAKSAGGTWTKALGANGVKVLEDRFA